MAFWSVVAEIPYGHGYQSFSTVAPYHHQHARTDHDSMTYHTTTTSVLTMATSIETMLPVIYREMVM